MRCEREGSIGWLYLGAVATAGRLDCACLACVGSVAPPVAHADRPAEPLPVVDADAPPHGMCGRTRKLPCWYAFGAN